tara:strand:- start:1621 stop:2163 length:543 start_codon:yes stop_codon:yes gene_type:complete
MAISLTANGYQINSGTEVTASSAAVNGYERGQYATPENMSEDTGSTLLVRWTPVENFNKKSASSTMVVEGLMVGMYEHSHPYGGTCIALRHSDGTVYQKHAGTTFLPSTSGNHTVLWMFTVAWTASDCGSKTGDFDVLVGYHAASGSGNKPWRGRWNWNNSEDSRAQQQGSTIATMEIEP